MAVSDSDLIQAWTRVLTLSRLKRGDVVTVLTTEGVTHPQTLRCAMTAVGLMGARANRLDLSPVNGDKSLSREEAAQLAARAEAVLKENFPRYRVTVDADQE